MNLTYVFEQGNIVLMAVFLLLASMSVISWYFIFWKALKLRKEYRLYKDFCKTHITSPNWPSTLLPTTNEGSINILTKEIEKLKPVLALYDREGRRKISMHLAQNLDNIRTWLDKGLTMLASIGSSAPFIGLFGTVWGIYGALTKIATEGNAGLSVVAGPMGEALVATAIGLFAAIPAVLAYNAFVRLNRLLVQNLRHIAEQMTTYISIPSLPQEVKENITPLKGSK